MSLSRLWFVALVASFVINSTSVADDKPIRVGIIGCDTSHVKEFTKLINDPNTKEPLAGIKITAAYPGGTDVPASKDRIEGFVKNLREQNVKIVDSLDELSKECDAFLLESVDGRPHLEQFRAVAKGKPVFIDKPTAVSLADIISIFHIADETHTPVFSSSSLRYCDEVKDAAKNASIKKMLACQTAGPFNLMAHHPDLFFYGIHGVEPLFTIMGTGCESVSRTDAADSTMVVGKWKDGRLGSYCGLKEGHMYSICTLGSEGVVQHQTKTPGYVNLVDEICKFFKSQEPPVGHDQTIEIYAFMEAADESKHQDGKSVMISEIIHRAEEKSAADLKATTAAK